MIRRARLSLLVVTVVATVTWGSSSWSLSQQWDVSSGFSAGRNPNGVWTYGWQDRLGGTLMPYNSTGTVVPGTVGWWTNGSTTPGGMVARNMTDQPVEHIAYHKIGQVILHPGPADQKATVRWTSPLAAALLVRGTFSGLDLSPTSATTDVHVVHNGKSLFDANIRGFCGTGTRPASGPSPQQSFLAFVCVAKGDTIDFAVGFGGNGYSCDTTGLDASIRVVSAGLGTIHGKLTTSVPADSLVARIQIETPEGPLSVWTAGDGMYAAPVPVGENTISIARPGYRPQRTMVRAAKDSSTRWDAELTPTVDFSYAFAAPHRMTATRPNSGDKTLLDLSPGSLQVRWTYDDLSVRRGVGFGSLQAVWGVQIIPEIDGNAFAQSKWTRSDGSIPVLENAYEATQGSIRIEAVGSQSAMVCRVLASNTGDKAHVFTIRCVSTDRGDVPGWFERGRGADYLTTGTGAADDRVLLMRVGGDEYPLNWKNTLTLVWKLNPGESRTGWILRPYRARLADLPALRKHDWQSEFAGAKKDWTDLLARAVRVQIPDEGVRRAFYACLADIFVMREPIAGGYIAGTAGTEVYRAPNTGEPAFAAIALDQVGLHQDAELGFRMRLDEQAADGCWASPPIDTTFWCAAGFKAWVIMEHYRLTRDRQYLATAYPRMLAASRWHERRRAESRRLENGRRTTAYGMLAGGLIDCGMADPSGRALLYPHNIWTVYGDRLALEAAEILGKTGDAAELKEIARRGYDDLLASMEAGAIRADGYRWLSAAPEHAAGSQWGVLNALFPCRLLPPDHPLVLGSIRRMESNMSPGGLPIHTGYMADGMWVAITLDNLGEAHLVRGDGDAFARHIYPVLNHATPLVTWCEERGKEAGAADTGGDRHHLYTPVSVVRGLRDALVMEDGDGLHLALGTPRHWLSGKDPVGIADAPTHFGRVSFDLRYDASQRNVVARVVFPNAQSLKWAVLHIRLPGKLKIDSVNPDSKARLLPDRSGIRWESPRGEVHVVGKVR